jgi:hypothetical protein
VHRVQGKCGMFRSYTHLRNYANTANFLSLQISKYPNHYLGNIGQYRQILQTLKRRIRQETGHRWRPTRVICDYEQSLIAAVQKELPNCQVSGYYFHFTYLEHIPHCRGKVSIEIISLHIHKKVVEGWKPTY